MCAQRVHAQVDPEEREAEQVEVLPQQRGPRQDQPEVAVLQAVHRNFSRKPKTA